MADQCKNCNKRGDIVECIKEECSAHESWYVQQLQEKLDTAIESLENTLKFMERFQKMPGLQGLIQYLKS